MDAQSRDRPDGVDPADQWVLNPRTGTYELRLDDSVPRQDSGRARRETASAPRTRPSVPGQRGRRSARAGSARADGRPGGSGRRGRKARKSGRRKALRWTGGALGLLLLGGSVGAYLLYDRLNGNLNTVDVGDAVSGRGLKDGPLNILVIGTDKRTGEGNEGYGDKGSEGHADTTFLFHVSADRTNTTALSIPRDLVIDIPECPTGQPDGSTLIVPAQPGARFNESFGQRGRDPGCTMRTVKAITGLPMDHFMMVDFNAVKTLTTAIGGVDICLDKPMKDKDSLLDLPVGPSTVQGEQALAFVRNRHGLRNDSDLDRIAVQQQFVASMIRKLKNEVLGDPKAMFDLADSMTKALTVDTGIGDVPRLTALAGELGKIDVKNITLMTVPVIDNPAEGPVKATVVLNPVEAPQVFAMLANDVSFTEVEKEERAAGKEAAARQRALLKGPRAQASEIRVDVYNGSSTNGAAQTTLDWLRNVKGVLKSANRSNAPEKIAKTRLEYAPDQADQARALADMLGLPAAGLRPGGAPAGSGDAGDAGTDAGSGEFRPMTLTLGADFRSAGVPIGGPRKPPKGVRTVEADRQICAK
ncbi:LCP family protein [Streptomyces sp. NPDC020141]|uniref:LCP family protein n=1 Tax=Streptomyces sp. NPDC020141 TaxID=3365065 RepID=UPI0037B616E9